MTDAFAFKPVDGAWIEITDAGVRLPGGGEGGEDVVMSRAFVESLPEGARLARGFLAVIETPLPEEGVVIGQTIEDVDGVPTRTWVLED
jgi:hypothetical protein